ncbi:long-chain acyl-CoA synthetase [Arcanobacterium wilhelmae]|uniref:Acyl-CoA synthetase n=1 Tax=Arcanobacterium wilhelmae TaxID=1803177 RepID=A0ABT9N9H0_9ACTO|nr:AMP-dependent synthetase/ligase [Arcanobacterium wilhelmae]MDP9800354.1 long-chain acyl-CoA synthetase [Arcanobacterium wilhelmae]WFN89790.1 AMP-dependent synthetase/ligase [Arcanobacterium wilhelmae]
MKNVIDEEGVAYTPGKFHVEDTLSIPKWLIQLAADRPLATVIERKVGLGNAWVPVTYRQYIGEIRALARGLIAHGVKPGDNVAIMGHTSDNWAMLDYAIQMAGAVVIPIYETDTAPQIEWIFEDSNVRFAFAEDESMAGVMKPMIDRFENLEEVFVIANDAISTLTAEGRPELDEEIDRRVEALRADDIFTVIYTSGTTGRPKGVELTHRNYLHTAINGPLDDELKPALREGGRVLLFLPLAHSFARFINMAVMYAGMPIGYSPDAKNLVADMQSFRPTFVLAVPRVFEKIYNAADAKAGKGAKLKMFRYFAKVAIEYSRALDTKEGPSPWLRAQRQLGDKLVYSKIRQITGGQFEWAVSGGAPLGARLAHFFRGIGMPILEGYGLTESSAPTSVNRCNRMRIGSVGPAYAGTYVKASEEGEILIKGEHVFHSYRNNPQATAESFTEDGWFKSGDLGHVDEDGFIWITGRKKELIVTAGGKNVSPAELEDRLRGHPLISQVVAVGDQKPFVSALITLDPDMLPGWLRNHNLPQMSLTDAVTDPQVIAAIDRAVKRTNEHVSRAESIRKFTILPTDFTVTNGYLTPSMKVKRAAVLKGFAAEIEKIYEGK